jgi:hypothetical protein
MRQAERIALLALILGVAASMGVVFACGGDDDDDDDATDDDDSADDDDDTGDDDDDTGDDDDDTGDDDDDTGDDDQEVDVDVPADSAGWTATGLSVLAGGQLQISATGTVTLENGGDPVGPEGIAGTPCGAGCPLPSANRGALLAQINTGKSIGGPWPPEPGQYTTIMEDGDAELGVNDDTPGDNAGSFHATVGYKPPANDCEADDLTFGNWWLSASYERDPWVSSDMTFNNDGSCVMQAEGAVGSWSLIEGAFTMHFSWPTGYSDFTGRMGAYCNTMGGETAQYYEPLDELWKGVWRAEFN